MNDMEFARQSLYTAELLEDDLDDLLDEATDFYKIQVSKGGKHIKTLRLGARSQAHALEKAKQHYPGHYISSVTKAD